MEENFVRIQNLSMSYGKVQALRDVSLTLPPQKLIGLIGPDGVGKSSLLSLVTGAHAMPSAGQLTVLGGDMRDKAHRDKVCPKIAYMPQGLGKNLYFTLTVEENLQFFGRLFGHDDAECRRRIDHLTRSTGLYPFLKRPAGKLSGGMKQKLGLCCSLIHDPDLLVLDEPTANLDYGNQLHVMEVTRQLTDSGYTVIQSTHNPEQAFLFSHSIVALHGGRVLAEGKPSEVVTEALMRKLYGADISVCSLYDDQIRVCVPKFVIKNT